MVFYVAGRFGPLWQPGLRIEPAPLPGQRLTCSRRRSGAWETRERLAPAGGLQRSGRRWRRCLWEDDWARTVTLATTAGFNGTSLLRTSCTDRTCVPGLTSLQRCETAPVLAQFSRGGVAGLPEPPAGFTSRK